MVTKEELIDIMAKRYESAKIELQEGVDRLYHSELPVEMQAVLAAECMVSYFTPEIVKFMAQYITARADHGAGKKPE